MKGGEIPSKFYEEVYKDLESYIQATEEYGQGKKCPVNSKQPTGWTMFETYGH